MGRKKRSARAGDAVYCEEHGDSFPCILCRHLCEGTGMGYFAIRKDPWAWCEACDAILEAEQGWSDRLYEFADWEVYCRVCYRKTLRRHQLLEWVVFASEE